MSEGLMHIMDMPYPEFHDKLYEMTGINIANKVMNTSFTRFMSQQTSEAKKNVTVKKDFKNMIVGTALNPDMLEDDPKGVHTAKWKAYTVNATNLNIFGAVGEELKTDTSVTGEEIKRLLRENKLIIKDVVIKTYNANLDWAFGFYVGPVYNDFNDYWSETVLIGDCQISYDEIDATCNKIFSDNLIKSNEFQDYCQELIDKLFAIANDEI